MFGDQGYECFGRCRGRHIGASVEGTCEELDILLVSTYDSTIQMFPKKKLAAGDGGHFFHSKSVGVL